MTFPQSVLCLIGLLTASTFARAWNVQVTGSDVATPLSIVSATVPSDFPEQGTLAGPEGETPFQKIAPDTITFVLRDAKAGESRSYTVRASRNSSAALAEKKEGKIAVTLGGKPVFTYNGTETEFPRAGIKPVYKRGGYIHPVLSPSGKLLTDDFPPNHIHHHGIWAPWTKTVFEGREPDFWNMGEGKGKVEFVKFGETWSGPVVAGFTTFHRFIDLTAAEPKAALNETWTVSAYALPGSTKYFIFDLVSTQTCATASALELPKYLYGGLGFRGNRAWNGENRCSFLASSGETDRLKGNETRGKWCHIGGEVDGTFTGIAILCHPSNFRAPQPMRLHPKEPFFCFAPSQAGDWAIEPGKPYVARYRFIVADGRPNESELDAFWNGYAHPPTARVSAE